MYGHSAVVFGVGYRGLKILILFGGSESVFKDVLSETTTLLLSKYIEMVVMVCLEVSTLSVLQMREEGVWRWKEW